MITFYLKSPKDDISPVWINAKCHDGRIRKSTGFEIPSKCFKDGWISAKGASPELRRKLETVESHLKHIRAKSDGLVLDKRIAGQPVYKRDIEAVLSGKQGSGQSFVELYEAIIKMAGRGALMTPKGQLYGFGTIKAWRTNLSHLRDYLRDKPVDSITTQDALGLAVHMTREGYSQNFIGCNIKNFKNALGIMHRLGYYKGAAHLHKDFRPKYQSVDKIYLNDTEISLLESVVLDNELKDNIRDLFLVMCYTGLRVSDVVMLDESHIQDNNVVIMNKKTSKVVVIPIGSKLRSILDKHDGWPRRYDPVVINREIKTIGLMAGINTPFTFRETKGGVTREVTKPKWELLSCHTGRRSMVTNMIKSGITYELANGVVGMSPAVFNQYNKMTAMEKAGVLRDHAFFK